MKYLKPFCCLLIFFLFSCSSSPEAPPNTLIIGIESGPKVLDPRYATDAISAKVCNLIYTGLMKRDKSLRLVPGIAERVEQPTPTQYRITLKQNILFHNGQKLTAKDVKFTFESILDEKTASPKKGNLKEVKSIETPDEQTVIITLKQVSAPFIENLTIGIVPEGSADLTKAPVGTGPFSFIDYQRGELLDLKRNENYFEGTPRLSGVRFKVLPDETVRLLELKKGNIHLVSNPITPAVLPWLAKQENIEIRKKTGTNLSYIGFNMNDPVLADPKVRKAIAHAIDRDAVITHLLRGLGHKAESLLSPINPFFTEILSLSYDPELSKKLLDEAGYSAPSNGEARLTLTYKTSKNPTRKTIVEVFGEQLRKVGINLEIKSFEWGTFFADVKSGNFQMYSLTWVGTVDPDIYYYIFHSDSLPPDGANRGRYVNPELDALLEAGRTETNFQKRKTIYDEVQRVIAHDLPYIHLWYGMNVAAINKNVKDFELYPDESLDSLTKVYFEKQ